MMQKPGTPGSMPSKSAIFAWIKQIVPEASSKMKVQDLGDGVIYCKIINHYYPGSINLNRLNSNPRNQYDFSLNLKMFQNALTVHKVNVPFDVGKISKQKFLQNWGLVNSLYRQLSSNNDDFSVADDSKSVSYGSSKFTPKRSFEMAFSHEHHQKLNESQTYMKPTYAPSREPTVHYQNNQTYSTPIPQTNVQPSIIPQNQLQSNNITNSQTNHTTHQQSGTNHGASTIYNHSGINQSAFNGFNFGMANGLSAINFNSASQNFSFNRPLNPASREPQNSIINKPSNFDQPISNKCWSVGKIPTREPLSIYGNQTQQNSGKYSVNSHIFQNNYNAVIDRVKEILLKNSHDIQKIRQIKILLNIPLNEDIVKIQQEQNVMINCTNINKPQQSLNSDKKIKAVEPKICTKQTIEGSKQNIQLPQEKQNKQVLGSQEKANQGSKSISNTGSNSQNVLKNQRITSASKQNQNSGRKIRNNFFGEGSFFRK